MLDFLVKSILLYLLPTFVVIILYVKLNKWYRRERVDGFHKKSVFVTGTDHGFGNLLVKKLDKMGLKVYAGCLTKEGAEKLRKTSSERVKPIMIDVTKRETMVAARDFIEKDLGPNEGLWGLVNNAGILRGVLFDFCQMDDYRKCMEVNFYGVMTTTEIFIPLIKRSRGRIVTITSAAARLSLGTEPYTSSKHAIEVYCTGLRRSMKTFNVNTSVIEPGVFRTPLSTTEFIVSEMDRTWNNLPTDLKQEYGQDYKDLLIEHMKKLNDNVPLTSWNEPEEVIRAIVHALSSKRPKARYNPGVDSKLFIRLFNVAPDLIFDTGMIKRNLYHKIAELNNKI